MKDNNLATVVGTGALVILGSLTVFLLPSLVNGHGHLLEPPNRSSLWRFPEEFGFFNPEPNYEDTQLFCGGVIVRTLFLVLF
jgi:hypothetical protein